MKRTGTIVLGLTLITSALLVGTGCGAVGADVRLEKLNRGAIDMGGKTLSGLPSDKINLDLTVAAQTIKIFTSANETVLTLVPSGATITIDGENVTFKGVKPDQMKVEWSVPPAD